MRWQVRQTRIYDARPRREGEGQEEEEDPAPAGWPRDTCVAEVEAHLISTLPR
jgi:hypothetical protein